MVSRIVSSQRAVKNICATMVVLRPAGLIVTVHLVLGRLVGLFQHGCLVQSCKSFVQGGRTAEHSFSYPGTISDLPTILKFFGVHDR